MYLGLILYYYIIILCGGYTHDVRLSYASAVSLDFSISHVQFISCIYAGKT